MIRTCSAELSLPTIIITATRSQYDQCSMWGNLDKIAAKIDPSSLLPFPEGPLATGNKTWLLLDLNIKVGEQ